MAQNTNDTSGGMVLGVIIGGILWWFDIVGIIAAFFIMVFIGGIVGATTTENSQQKKEEEKNLKQIWSSDAGIKLSFDFWEEDKKTRTNIILKEISAYEKEYEQELKRIDKEIKEITEEIENLDKNDDDYRYDREIKKDELREAKKDRANTIRDRKDFIKEYYFAGIYQGKNQKCVFNLKDLSNFANEKGEDLSGEELAELLGSKKLCKIFEEFGFF